MLKYLSCRWGEEKQRFLTHLTLLSVPLRIAHLFHPRNTRLTVWFINRLRGLLFYFTFSFPPYPTPFPWEKCWGIKNLASAFKFGEKLHKIFQLDKRKLRIYVPAPSSEVTCFHPTFKKIPVNKKQRSGIISALKMLWEAGREDFLGERRLCWWGRDFCVWLLCVPWAWPPHCTLFFH